MRWNGENKEPEAEFLGASFLCRCCKNKITLDAKDVSFYADSYECDNIICGGHGYVRMSFRCKCGIYHDVIVYKW